MTASQTLALIGALALLGACSQQHADSGAAVASERTSSELPIDATLPPVLAYRSPTCGCCELWVEHMRAAGFRVDVQTTDHMGAVKTEAGIPVGKESCHTARVGDYYIEGHVPASDVKRLLAEKPDARGLTVPGMVPGSPGMEQGGVRHAYDVLLVAKDGATSVFSRHAE